MSERDVPKREAGEVTRILARLKAGDARAADQLFPPIYGELRRLAQAALNGERHAHTLQATALVHEAYLKLVNQPDATWLNRAHFFAVAAQAMRRVLVDHARARGRSKRGGAARRQTMLAEELPIQADREIDLIALEEAMVQLAQRESTGARIVEMRFFAGLTEKEIASVLGMTERTVRRHWTYAKAWLFREISKGGPAPSRTGSSVARATST